MATPKHERLKLAATTVLFALGLGACYYDYAPPDRLPGISEGAVWAGGPDGGALIECFLDEAAEANWCTTWSDQVGHVTARTFFVLRETSRPVSEDELKGASFNGIFIRLETMDGCWNR